MDDIQFQTITSKLNAIVKLQAISAMQGKGLKEQVAALSSLDLQPKQIADILGKTPNHVSVILFELRKADKKISVQSDVINEPDTATGQV